ncbi:craniofacial development protein 2-like [Montipora capricornis]|uniref:craniofacial development protein 2-like n=1 Tax=Montipora capricornis TaxID=246305 RepID=UPI0035F1DBD9
MLRVKIENTRNSAGNGIPMTDSGQSRKEATVMTTGAVSAKTTSLIGFWNVRTIYEQGRIAQVIAEMKRYKLAILGISESRWTRSGRKKATTGETVLYFGREDDSHHEGVAIIIRKEMEKYLMEWKPVNSSIIEARLKDRQANLSIIQCYAPTNDSNDRD